ncbi:MAG: V-type ATPase subunit [Ruminococcus sp.]|nr:V-type ATPase subunit [Ruminococcus sp.]
MLEGFSTNAVVAKIRSIYGSMLTPDDFREMISKRSVSEVAEQLSSSKRFAPAFKDVDPNTVHRGLLERLIAEHNFNTYLRLTSFQGLTDKPFYDFLIKKNECAQLINLVNAVENGLTDSFVTAVPGYVLSHSRLDFLRLAKCQSFDELTAALKGTQYYKPLKSVARREDGSPDFTDAEVKLRTSYYDRLMKSVKDSFFGSEEDELVKTIRQETDIINIINCYRLKAYFGYSPEEIRQTELPYPYLGRRAVRAIEEAESPADMFGLIQRTTYGKYLTGEEEDIETAISRRSLEQMRHTVAKSNSAPTVLYAFMSICDTEMKNIFRVIEAVRYDVDPALIDRLLVI